MAQFSGETSMTKALVVTPVKDSIETTLDTARSVANSTVKVKHVIFNDFSKPETKSLLESNKEKIGYELIHLEDLTDHLSPNYKLILQLSQKMSLKENLPLLVVESDIQVRQDTIEKILTQLKKNPESGLIGAITVDERGDINFPYQKFKNVTGPIVITKRSLSFCCTLFSPEFLNKYDFSGLNDTKDWHDTHISKKATELGFQNTILMNAPVWHRPHGSRPWKQLKYTHPIKYYFLKFWKGMDKI